MSNQTDDIVDKKKRSISGRNRILIIVAGLVVLCICVGLAIGAYQSSTPEGKTTSTARAIQKELTRSQETAIAAIDATEAAKPTVTPLPSDTPFPTDTPGPTSTPTNTPEPEVYLRRQIEDALGSSNREVDRLVDFEIVTDVLVVRWAINDNLSEDLIKGGAKLDIVDILESIDDSGIDYSEVQLKGMFPLVDEFGNSTEVPVVEVSYLSDTVDKINWDNFLFENVYEIADRVIIVPAFRDDQS